MKHIVQRVVSILKRLRIFVFLLEVKRKGERICIAFPVCLEGKEGIEIGGDVSVAAVITSAVAQIMWVSRR